jgi:hypothetical protein
MKKLLITCIAALLLISCHSNRKQVHVFKQHTPNNTETVADDFIFWYIIYENGGSTVYYRTDKMLDLTGNILESLADVEWKVVRGTPPEFDEEESQEVQQADIELPEDQIAAIEQQAEAEADATEGDTDGSNGDADGSTGDGDSGGSSGDGGGGDGGGGDGGGGE